MATKFTDVQKYVKSKGSIIVKDPAYSSRRFIVTFNNESKQIRTKTTMQGMIDDIEVKGLEKWIEENEVKSKSQTNEKTEIRQAKAKKKLEKKGQTTRLDEIENEIINDIMPILLKLPPQGTDMADWKQRKEAISKRSRLHKLHDERKKLRKELGIKTKWD